VINAVTIKTLSLKNVADGQPGDVDLQQTNADKQAEFETLIAEQQGELPLPTDNFSPGSAADSQQVLLSEQSITPENPAQMHTQNENSELQYDAVKLDNPLLLQSKMLALAKTDSLSTTHTLTMGAAAKVAPPGLGQAQATGTGNVASILDADALPATHKVQPLLSTELGANQLNERYSSPPAANISITPAGPSQWLNNISQLTFAPAAQSFSPLKYSVPTEPGREQPISSFTTNWAATLSSGLELVRYTSAGEGFEIKLIPQSFSVAELVAPPSGALSPATLSPETLMLGQNLPKESEHIFAAVTVADKITANPGNNLSRNAAFNERQIANQQSAQLLHLSNNGQFNEVKIKDNNLGEMHFSVSGKQAEHLSVFAVQQQSQMMMQQHLFELKADLASEGVTELELFSSTEQQQQHKQQHLVQKTQNYADVEDSLNQQEQQTTSSERNRSTTSTSSLDIIV